MKPSRITELQHMVDKIFELPLKYADFDSEITRLQFIKDSIQKELSQVYSELEAEVYSEK